MQTTLTDYQKYGVKVARKKVRDFLLGKVIQDKYTITYNHAFIHGVLMSIPCLSPEESELKEYHDYFVDLDNRI